MPGMDFVVEGIKLATPRISVVLFPLLILIYIFAGRCEKSPMYFCPTR